MPSDVQAAAREIDRETLLKVSIVKMTNELWQLGMSYAIAIKLVRVHPQYVEHQKYNF